MASQVGEVEALRLHASELLVMLGTAVVMMFDRPVPAQPVAASPDLSAQQTLSVQQAQLANNG